MKKPVIVLFILLIYTRFIGLTWGLPYPMHPDERNMTISIEQLNCRVSNLKNCYNPHFFAYGQFPLYLGYMIAKLHKFLKDGNLLISYIDATVALRFISAVSSIINAYILLQIINLIGFGQSIKNKDNKGKKLILFLCLIFVPYFIQFSHFGTTESLIMLFYSLIVYFGIKLYSTRPTYRNLFWISFVTGLAVATKVSSILFLLMPILILMRFYLINFKKNYLEATVTFCSHLIFLVFLTGLISLIFSPHNLLSWREFIGAMQYESDVAFGRDRVFYTRQFVNTMPFFFQLTKIFPYVFGWPHYLLGLAGFFLLPWRNKKINLLRLFLISFFIPTVFMFAKWTRFISPVFPLISIFAVLFIFKITAVFKLKLTIQRLIFYFLILITILPGVAYLTIYIKPDVRFVASLWVFKNIPGDSIIFSETANVVDIPIPSYLTINQVNLPPYRYISFNLYDLDLRADLLAAKNEILPASSYLFIPSRRVYYNHTCFRMIKLNTQLSKVGRITNKNCKDMEKKYPMLFSYYRELFSSQSDFTEVVEFASFPRIELFGKKIIEFADEDAEETWTVFDHPVIRIYKRQTNKPT